MEEFFSSKAWKIGWKVAVVIILMLVLNPFSCVNGSDRGVRTRFGAVVGETLKPGLVVRIPLVEKIQTYSIQPQQIKVHIDVGAGGAITKDNQTVGATVQIFYRLDEARIPEIARGYNVDKLNTILTTTGESAIKTTVGTYTIFDLAASQNEVTGKIASIIRDSIKQYPIDLVDLKLVNYDWSDSFDAQIAETMKKAQEVRQKEQEVQVATLEAQKMVVEAEAQQKATIAKAEGEKQRVALEAEAKVLEGEGIRKYNQAIAANLAQELELRRLAIEAARVDKWDGHYVPNNMYGPIPVSAGGVQGK